MMLDMLTADAAAKHGTEYSPTRASPSNPGNGYFLAQMPLSIFTSVLRKQPASPAPAPAPAVAEQHNGAKSPSASPPSPSSPCGSQRKPMTAEPNALPTSPTPSRPVSSSSIASAEGKHKNRVPRPKTTYNLAHPPTTGPRQKLHLRPKVLLQLHQVIPSSRPKPVYEVIPFSLLAPRSTRRLARTFNTKDRLCATDLLIVKAEEYGNKDEDKETDDERWGTRDVVGIICPAKKCEKDPGAKAEVLLEDGSSWEITNMPNGGYEFAYTDDHGLSLRRRWVPKSAHVRRVSTMSSGSQPLGSPVLPDEKKFNFSTISANSRRHPVIASMSRTNIDVLESYTMPSATSPPTPSLPPSGFATPLATPASITEASSFFDKNRDSLTVKTDDALRTFIVVSGIWIALSENWSPVYSLTKHVSSPYPMPTSNTARPVPNRTLSMSFLDSPRSVSPASTIDENRRTLPKFFRSGSQRLNSNTSSPPSASSPTAGKDSPSSPSPRVKTRSRRSNSTGNAELIPRNGSTRKRFGLALEDQTLQETEEERQSKRSMELLRIKELALPNTPSPPVTPAPVKIIEPPSEFRSPSPASPTQPRTQKSLSAFTPIATAGLWDSGVADGPGLKSRPTSLVVNNDKKMKAELKAKRKQERAKSKEKNKGKETDYGSEGLRRSERFKLRIKGIFRWEKV